MINTLLNQINDLDEKLDAVKNEEFKNKYGIAKTLIEENINYPGMKADKFSSLNELK